MNYDVTIQYTTSLEDSKGKLIEKKIKEHYLVTGFSCSEAERIIKEKFKALLPELKIVSIKESAIIALIKEGSNE